MSWPTNPTNGQTATVNNIDYVYDSTSQAWTRQPISNPNGATFTRVTTVTDATSITANADTTDVVVQLNTQTAGTLTINAPTGTIRNGQKLLYRIRCTNVQTLSWNAVFAGSTDLTLTTSTTGGSKFDYFGVIYNSTSSKWDLIAKIQGF
jgi:hypothetical protein